MQFVPDDPLEAWHLAQAIERWRPVARASGVPVPTSLVLWAETCRLRASKGQQGTPLDELVPLPAQSAPMRLFLSVDEVATALGVVARTVKRLVAGDDPELASVKVAGRRLVHIDDLSAYADRLRRAEAS